MPRWTCRDFFRWKIIREVLPGIVLSGLGMTATGILLDKVADWAVFKEIPVLFILVPPLLGLKGNLEMTLASRLSTAANGHVFDTWPRAKRYILCNISLLLIQAIVVAVIAAFVALALGLMSSQETSGIDALLMMCVTMLTAFVSGGVNSVLMSALIYKCFRCGINPDNIATPIAASLGDFVTLVLLASFGNAILVDINPDARVPMLLVVVAVILVTLPFWIRRVRQVPEISRVLVNGWVPLFVGMGCSSLGGVILENFVSTYPGIAALTPTLCGVGGGLASVHACRMCTSVILSSGPRALQAFEKMEQDTIEMHELTVRGSNDNGKQQVDAVFTVGCSDDDEENNELDDDDDQVLLDSDQMQASVVLQVTSNSDSHTDQTSSQSLPASLVGVPDTPRAEGSERDESKESGSAIVATSINSITDNKDNKDNTAPGYQNDEHGQVVVGVGVVSTSINNPNNSLELALESSLLDPMVQLNTQHATQTHNTPLLSCALRYF